MVLFRMMDAAHSLEIPRAAVPGRKVPYDHYSDEFLAKQAAEGDGGAFEALLRRHSRQLYSFAYRLLGDREMAGDVVQDAFISLYTMLPHRNSELPIRSLIYRIARNRAIDLLRERKAVVFSDLPEADEGDFILDGLADPAPLPQEIVERRDLQKLLSEAIAALPLRYRQVVALRYTTELTFAEIGEVLQAPENTVKTLFQRAKGMLREQLRGRL